MAPSFIASMSAARVALVLRLLGLAVLLAGYTGAGLAWRAQDRIDQENAILQANDVQLSPLESRKGSRQVEQMYGKAGLLSASWMDWAESLMRGKGLAKTLIVLSSAAAIGCFIAAGWKQIEIRARGDRGLPLNL
jgi:hypothetical protein